MDGETLWARPVMHESPALFPNSKSAEVLARHYHPDGGAMPLVHRDKVSLECRAPFGLKRSCQHFGWTQPQRCPTLSVRSACEASLSHARRSDRNYRSTTPEWGLRHT